jgi:hypothetical protein
MQIVSDEVEQGEVDYTAAKAARAVALVREAQELITTDCEPTNVACAEAQIALVEHLCTIHATTPICIAAKLSEVKHAIDDEREHDTHALLSSARDDLLRMTMNMATNSKEQSH